MNLYTAFQYFIILLNIVVVGLVFTKLVVGKQTWNNNVVKLGVFMCIIGLSAQVYYSVLVIATDTVPDILPFWMFKDLGLALLFLLQIYKPRVYNKGITK